MILQIKATKANGDVINIYPERDGDDQTDEEIETVCVGWAKLQSELNGEMETDFVLLTLYSHGEILEQYTPPTQPEPAGVPLEIQARMKALYQELGRGSASCDLTTPGVAKYVTIKSIIESEQLKTTSEEQFQEIKPLILALYKYDPETEYVLSVIPLVGSLEIYIYTYD